MQNKPRSFNVAFLLGLFLGAFGADRFYLGQIGRGFGRFILGFLAFFGLLGLFLCTLSDKTDMWINPYKGYVSFVANFLFSVAALWTWIDLIRLVSSNAQDAHGRWLHRSPNTVGTPARHAGVAVGLSLFAGFVGADRFFLGRPLSAVGKLLLTMLAGAGQIASRYASSFPTVIQPFLEPMTVCFLAGLCIWYYTDAVLIGVNVLRDGKGNSLLFPSTESPLANATPADQASA